jgi:hypothetical protein
VVLVGSDTDVLVGSDTDVLVGSDTVVLVGSDTVVLVGSDTVVLVESDTDETSGSSRSCPAVFTRALTETDSVEPRPASVARSSHETFAATALIDEKFPVTLRPWAFRVSRNPCR